MKRSNGACAETVCSEFDRGCMLAVLVGMWLIGTLCSTLRILLDLEAAHVQPWCEAACQRLLHLGRLESHTPRHTISTLAITELREANAAILDRTQTRPNAI